VPWVAVPGPGVVRLAADGLSATLVVLSVAWSPCWRVAPVECELERPTSTSALLLLQASAQSLVFLLPGLSALFLAWELELVPVYLLIAIWGGAQRQYAQPKFILYTRHASLFDSDQRPWPWPSR